MYSSEIMQPFGREGMILLASNQDDTTISIPDIGFDFFYNGTNCRNTMKISGNSWVGFTGEIQQLKVNKKDTRVEKIYYAKENIYGSNVFRIRWEGDHYYNAYGAYDIIWELILYQDSAMVLIIEKITNDGIDRFVNPDVGTISLNFVEGKSYVFIPSVDGGKNYTVQEGSYIEAIVKYLLVDGSDIKHWDAQNSQYSKVSELPLTAEKFLSYGDDVFHKERNGLISNAPALKIWIDTDRISINKIIETAIPKATLIELNRDILLVEEYIQGINNVVTTLENIGNGTIKFIISNDSGVTWNTFDGSEWIDIDKSNLDIINTSAMSVETIEGITESQWDILCSENNKLRFAIYMKVLSSSDVLKIKEIRFNYTVS